MKNKILHAFIACSMLIGPQAAFTGPAKAAAVQPAPELAAFDRRLRETEFNGAVLVARGGKLLLSQGYGMANFEWNVPVTPDTKFKIGSITKQFTAASILKLQERGLLKVTDGICKWINPCPEAWGAVTLHHLLTHSSGVANPEEADRMPVTAGDLVKLVAAAPLNFKPGEKWSYSNGGYDLLGFVIEKVSGKPYAEFVKSELLDPLGMRNSGYEDGRTLLLQRADGYEWRQRQMLRSHYQDMSIPYSAGALYSTVEDLWIWEQALFGGRVLKPATLKAMLGLSDAPPAFPEHEYRGIKLRYGYGIERAPLGHAVEPAGFDGVQYGHGGDISGFTAYMTRSPDLDATVIVLSNVTGRRSALLVTQQALAALAGKPAPGKLAPQSPAKPKAP